jgi:hypothetical protein
VVRLCHVRVEFGRYYPGLNFTSSEFLTSCGQVLHSCGHSWLQAAVWCPSFNWGLGCPMGKPEKKDALLDRNKQPCGTYDLVRNLSWSSS